MYKEYDKQSSQEPALEFLARELHVPIDEVASLYNNELARLKADASVDR